MSANPFEILRLDPSAPEEEIVRQAGRLRQRATDETALNAIRQAVQMLTTRSEDRLLYSVLTHPSPCHRWPALDRFAAAFRRPPAATNAPAPCPSLDKDEFGDLIRSLSAEELELDALPLEPIVRDEPADEIHRQTAEVLWQSLLFDTGA
jgi:hypothetical protein